MAHPDHETRIGAHSVFSIVLMPSLSSSRVDQKTQKTQKVPSESFHLGEAHIDGNPVEGGAVVGVSREYTVHPYHGYNFSGALTDGKDVRNL